jgi:hypothetical protein
MRNITILLVVLVAFLVSPACFGATPFSLVYDNQTLPGMPGDTLTFTGTITNDTSVELFING